MKRVWSEVCAPTHTGHLHGLIEEGKNVPSSVLSGKDSVTRAPPQRLLLYTWMQDQPFILENTILIKIANATGDGIGNDTMTPSFQEMNSLQAGRRKGR